MPWSRRKTRNLATQTGLILGFIACIPINLLTSWLQQDILSNIAFAVFIFLLCVAVWLIVLQIHSAILTSAFLVITANVPINLFSPLIQDKLFHNSFNLLNIVLIVAFTILCLVLSTFIVGHPITKLKRKLGMTYRANARSTVYLSSEGKVIPKQRRQTSRQKKRRA